MVWCIRATVAYSISPSATLSAWPKLVVLAR